MHQNLTAEELELAGYQLERTLNCSNAPYGIRSYLDGLKKRVEDGSIEDWKSVQIDKRQPYYRVYVKPTKILCPE